MEALNRALFTVLAAGYAPEPHLLLAAKLLASLGVAVVPLVLLVIWFLQPSSRDDAVAAAICGAVALAASEWLAAFTAHPRPFMLGLSPVYVAHAAEGSFPSAHASLMLAVAAALLLAKGTRAWGALVAAAALLTAWARVYLGLHFPLDIAGSIAVAALVAAVLRSDYWWIAWLRRELERGVVLGIRVTARARGRLFAPRRTVGK